MTSVTVKQQINASPTVVFETLTNYSKRAEIVSGVQTCEVLSDGPVGKGTRFRETRVMFGREASEEMEISEFDPPRSLVLEADNHGAHYRTAHQLDSAGDGVLVTLTFGATATNFIAKIMVVLMMPLMKKSIARCLQQDLVDLKQYLESSS